MIYQRNKPLLLNAVHSMAYTALVVDGIGGDLVEPLEIKPEVPTSFCGVSMMKHWYVRFHSQVTFSNTAPQFFHPWFDSVRRMMIQLRTSSQRLFA